jgi:hypothetical protein
MVGAPKRTFHQILKKIKIKITLQNKINNDAIITNFFTKTNHNQNSAQ